ncbi:unnamed protein product, partial [Rotaria socialis]
MSTKKKYHSHHVKVQPVPPRKENPNKRHRNSKKKARVGVITNHELALQNGDFIVSNQKQLNIKSFALADAETIPTDRIQPIVLKRIRSSKSVATSVYTNEVDFDDIVKFQNLSAISKSSIPTIITDNFARPARRMETLNQLQGQTISASGKTGIKVHDHNSSNVREQWQSYISRAGGRQVDTDLRSVKQSNFRLPIPEEDYKKPSNSVDYDRDKVTRHKEQR